MCSKLIFFSIGASSVINFEKLDIGVLVTKLFTNQNSYRLSYKNYWGFPTTSYKLGIPAVVYCDLCYS